MFTSKIFFGNGADKKLPKIAQTIQKNKIRSHLIAAPSLSRLPPGGLSFIYRVLFGY